MFITGLADSSMASTVLKSMGKKSSNSTNEKPSENKNETPKAPPPLPPAPSTSGVGKKETSDTPGGTSLAVATRRRHDSQGKIHISATVLLMKEQIFCLLFVIIHELFISILLFHNSQYSYFYMSEYLEILRNSNSILFTFECNC